MLSWFCLRFTDCFILVVCVSGWLYPDFPNSLQLLSKESLFWDEPQRLQSDGVMQHSSRSGNFPEHLRGHSPMWLFCLSASGQTCRRLVTWNLNGTAVPPTSPSSFPLGSLRRLWDPQGEKDYIHVLQPDTKTSCLTSLKTLPRFKDWV